MRKRGMLLGTFILLFVVTLVGMLLFQLPFLSPVRAVLEWALLPLQRVTHTAVQNVQGIGTNQEIERLRFENSELQKKIVDQSLLERDVTALRDQFATTIAPTQYLAPASVVGVQTLIPGTQTPTTLLIDKGKDDGVSKGMAVIYKDSVVGIVSSTTPHLSKIDLSLHPSSAITAVTGETSANGVVKGTGDDLMLLDNVVLSEKLEEGDIVLTKGDVNEEGIGYPKDIIIGKITSIQKTPSALFQTAEVKSLLDFSKLSTVFVVTDSL